MSFEPNHHAHIIVDWLNHETGKTVKFGKGKYAETQRENVRLQSVVETANIERDKALIMWSTLPTVPMSGARPTP